MSVCAGDGTCRGTRAKKSTFKWFQSLYRNYESPGLNRQVTVFSTHFAGGLGDEDMEPLTDA